MEKAAAGDQGRCCLLLCPSFFPLIIMCSQLCYRRHQRNWFFVFVLCQLPFTRLLVWHAVSSLLLALLSARCATVASCLENPMVTWGFSSCHVEMTVFQGSKLLPVSILSSEVHQLSLGSLRQQETTREGLRENFPRKTLKLKDKLNFLLLRRMRTYILKKGVGLFKT